ncbi:MAG: STAS domain-containing protein [Candidatus Omnitrophica bacterium]|nr:STAS domain-containing protein [Candidatus Omnitrophota bacterium]MCA9425242.1 STAS domain-containing protein [Candidatus Omnitrophota bacterium]MCA9446668.1 STAS domain-containing protein [Candidatus Omnitrophota bacterium]MCB9768212.1 STAS domain-containing protein [Candidatus Omnitrophota bacterium]
MEYKVRTQNEAKIIELTGALDLHSASDAGALFRETLDANPPLLIIDLSELQYLKSSGYQALVELVKRSEERDIPVAIVGPHEGIRAIMKVFRLDVFFPVYDSVEDALESISSE